MKKNTIILSAILSLTIFSAFPAQAEPWGDRVAAQLGQSQKQTMEAQAQAAAREDRVQLYWCAPLNSDGTTDGPNGGIPAGAIFYSSVDLVWEPLAKTEVYPHSVHQFGGLTGRVYISWDNGRGPLFPYSAEQYAQIRQAVSLFCQTYIREEMTDFEKEMQIIQYLVGNVTYPYARYLAHADTKDDHSAYGALVLGEAVCEGYAEAFCWLADACDLESRFIYGWHNNELHDWNMVKLDGNWYQLDITSDDPTMHNYLPNGYGWGNLRNQYLNLTDAQMNQDHLWTPVEGISCTSTACGPAKIEQQVNGHEYPQQHTEDYCGPARIEQQVNRSKSPEK